MGERIDTPRGSSLTVEHLTASLANIEVWCRAVRRALDSIPDKDAIRFPDDLGGGPLQAQNPKPKQKAGECPPPDAEMAIDAREFGSPLQAQNPKPKQKAGECPPPDADDSLPIVEN